MLLPRVSRPQDEASDSPDRHGVAREMLRQVASFSVAQRPSWNDTGGNFCPGSNALGGPALLPSFSGRLPGWCKQATVPAKVFKAHAAPQEREKHRLWHCEEEGGGNHLRLQLDHQVMADGAIR